MKIALILCAVAVAVLVWRSSVDTKSMEAALPPVYWIERYEADEILRTHGARAAWVLGTGSMQPVIRAGLPTEKVALVIYDNDRDFNLLGRGALVLFDHSKGLLVHQITTLDGDGWVSSGSANAHYDTGRVTRENFRGVVTKIYNIK